MVEAEKRAFEEAAGGGLGDAAALARDLRQGVTDAALRELAALAVHAAAAAPERMAEIYDHAAAGWLGGDLPPSLPVGDPLPISAGFWQTFWNIATPRPGGGRLGYAPQMMELAGQLDPRINARMAAAALEFPGVGAAAAGGIPEAHDVEWLSQFSPASLGYALAQQLVAPGSSASDPYWTAALPYLRHMPPPLNFINVQVIQSMPLWGLVAGYTSRALDRVGLGGFLTGQVGHHYSALASAVTLGAAAVRRPDNLEIVLDCLLKGWAHGRATQPLLQVDWAPLWPLRVDEVRHALRVRAFESPHARAVQTATGWSPRIV